MTASLSATCGIVIVLCGMTCVCGSCFNENEQNTAKVSVTDLHHSIAKFATVIFKAAVQETSTSVPLKYPSGLSTTAWILVISAFDRTREVISKENFPKNKPNSSNATVQSSKDENIIISPINIWFALMSVYFGAQKNTSDELGRALGVNGMNKDALGDVYKQLKSQFESRPNGSNIVSVVNRLYFQKDPPKIIKCVEHYFKTEIELVDFVRYPESSRKKINEWVGKQTENKIKNLLPENFITTSTRLVTVNAAYFKGEWNHRFEEKYTYQSIFFRYPISELYKIPVSMMLIWDYLPYAQSMNLGCTAIELPYTGGEISMIALLPDKEESVENLSAKLTKSDLEKLYSSMVKIRVELHFPKFCTEHERNLTELLSTIGITEIFNKTTADLLGFTHQSLHVDKTLHKAIVEVDEKGKETAPAFGSTYTSSNGMREPDFKVVLFNRPFIFLIRHNKSNSILFMGLIYQPSTVQCRAN